MDGFTAFAEKNGLDKGDLNFGGPYSEIFNAWISKYCGGNAGNWDRWMKEIYK
jgi:hypothetical protein